MATHNPLVIKQLQSNNWRDFQLVEPLTWHSSGGDIYVPVGFITDFASVPRAVWSWLPPYGRWSTAAVVHDYLTRLHANDMAHPLAPTRADCDRIFYEALKELRVNRFDRGVMWLAVRTASLLFGWGGRRRVALLEEERRRIVDIA